MATSVGSACITLMPSMDGFAGKICSEFGSTGSKAGKSFGGAMTAGVNDGVSKSSGLLGGLGTVARGVATVAAAGMTALTAAVTAIGGAALSAYADYEQLVGGVDTLFGSASGKLQAYAADAYKTCGLSANQYMTQATSFAASLVSSCGGDVAKAADYANMAMGDMSDNVNKMGSNMVDVQNAYQGFAKQNYTMLDNLKLGYGGTKEEMQRLIADANKLREAQGKNADLTIDSYADVVEAIHTVQESMGITGTTAEEAATTISGSIGMAKAAWENFLIGLGRDDVDFSQLTEQLLTSIGAVATNVAPRVAQIGAGIIQAFPTVLAGLGAVLAPIMSEALATAWNIAVQALSGIGISLPAVDASQITAAFQQVVDLAGAIAGAVKAAAAAITSAFAPAASALGAALAPVASQVASSLMPALSSLGTALGNLASAILPVISAAIQAVAPVVGSILSGIVSLATAIGTALSPAITNIAAIVQAVLPVVQQVFTAWGTAVQAVISSAFAFIEAVVTTVMNVINAVISTVLAAINGDWSGVWNGVQSLASAVWDGIGSIIGAGAGLIQSVISSALSFIQSVWSSAWSAVSSFFGSIWDGLKSAAQSGVDAVYSTVVGIKDRIVGFFAGAGSWLVSSGKAMLDGLASGISDAIGGVVDTVQGGLAQIRGLFPFSPAKYGPFSGHGYTTYSGKALMEGWAEGIGGGTGSVVSAITGAMETAQGMLSTGLTVAPAAGAAVAAGATYNITVNGGSVNADQRIMQAVDVLVSAAKRSAGSGR